MARNRNILIALMVFLLAIAFIYQRVSSPASQIDYQQNPTVKIHTPQQTFDKARYSTTDPTSIWVIVNKQHPINPRTYAPTDLTAVGNGQQMRSEAANALLKMFAAAKASGYILVADSGYRSFDYQVNTYNSVVKAYGQAYADTVSARPGFSEHQTGWAVDIGSGNCNVADCFANLPAGQWVYANAYKYGFIQRYTAANTAITGYSAEAWHFRYVGTDLSIEMHKNHILSLEQFFGVTGGPVYVNSNE